MFKPKALPAFYSTTLSSKTIDGVYNKNMTTLLIYCMQYNYIYILLAIGQYHDEHFPPLSLSSSAIMYELSTRVPCMESLRHQ